MNITRDFKLSLVAGRSVPLVINANQYDDGEVWRFTLLDENGQKYSPSTGSIIGLKSDGHIIANAGTVSSTGLVIIAETEQMTAAVGKNIFELLIDDDTHGTANFIVFVEPRPGADGTPSDSDLAVFQEAIDAAAQIGDASELVDDVAVLKSRMDEFTTLTDGSTTGDAELADIRVGADGTIYPNAGDAVRGQVSDLKNAINDIDDVLYPNSDVMIANVPLTAQSSANAYYPISTLKSGNAYRIVLVISDATRLYNIRTSKSESGSGNVDVITDDFVGDSWVSGKTVIYTPSVDDIAYLQVQFNSAYVANEASITVTVYDYTKETTTAIQELKSANTEIIETVDAITPEIYLEDEYNLLPPFGYTVNKFITIAGIIRDYTGNVLSDYIPIDSTQGYICNYAKTASVVYGNSALTGNVNPFDRNNFCFFDENKNVVPFTGNTTTVSKAIPENAKYIRVTINSEEVYPLARLIYGNYETQPIVRICDYHKRLSDIYAEANTGMEQFHMVMFGDSITHGSLSVSDEGISYVDYANDYLHSNIINVGFGGTRMTYPTIEGTSLFCFRNLVDCIVSDSADAWDDLDAYATTENTSYLPHLNTLKAIDWSNVHAVGLLYGANDFTSNTPVGNVYNEDVLNFDGACASALKKLLTKYPHLQVILFGPFDRMMDTSNPTTMTDTTPNSAGLFMSDYANSLENVVKKFHCPLIKTGELFGINAQTILTYAPDGTHPRANIAQKRLGWLFAQAVKNNLAPFNG